jgi:guanosine-3',5'-bis(diphosphate) 3'-pyrophosphohydrolase
MHSLLETATNYAVEAHWEQKYGNKPYAYHLSLVYVEAKKYIKLIPAEHRKNVLAAAWLHDILEDTCRSYNEIVEVTNVEVADIVYDVTNELGKNRKERAEKTYPKIASNPLALYIKLCDRLPNMRESCGKRLGKMYAAEYHDFKYALYNGTYIELWEELDKAHRDLVNFCAKNEAKSDFIGD